MYTPRTVHKFKCFVYFWEKRDSDSLVFLKLLLALIYNFVEPKKQTDQTQIFHMYCFGTIIEHIKAIIDPTPHLHGPSDPSVCLFSSEQAREGTAAYSSCLDKTRPPYTARQMATHSRVRSI